MTTALNLQELQLVYERRTRLRMDASEAEELTVTATNGEVVRILLARTVLFPGFLSSTQEPELGVIVEPVNLPEGINVWGRRFAGPGWPSWNGIRAAIEEVAEEAAEIRATRY